MKYALAVALLLAQSDKALYRNKGSCENLPNGGIVCVGQSNTPTKSFGTSDLVPNPVWVPDPSAGHYDCPNGWTAYSRSEPDVVPSISNAPLYPSLMDAKGHFLRSQPKAGICVKDQK